MDDVLVYKTITVRGDLQGTLRTVMTIKYRKCDINRIIQVEGATKELLCTIEVADLQE